MITQRMMVRGVKTVPETWEITVNTEATAQGEKTTGIPFNLYGQDGVTLTVDWGDGTTSILSSSNYTASNAQASVHEYAEAGIYTISVSSKQFSKCYLMTIAAIQSINILNSAVRAIYWYRRTLISVDKILPNVAGRNGYTSPTSTTTLRQYKDSFSYLFSQCKKCTTIPFGLFDNNPAIKSFEFCFYQCASLTAIPAGLFNNNTVVTDFSNCFHGCSSLTTLPDGLFDNNPAVTDFHDCFYGCWRLTAIPDGLFDNNLAVTTFLGCFCLCTSLTSIPSELFKNNTAVTNFASCFQELLINFSIHIGSSIVTNVASFASRISGTTRTIYVPIGSTTETTFNAVASDLGLTIIGE